MERPLCCSPYHSYCCQGRWDWTLGSLQSRVASHPGRTGKSASRMEGESSPVKSFETETRPPGGLLILLLTAALIDPGATSHNPHHPVNMTWVVYNPETRGLLNLSSNVAPKGTWWPELTFDLCIMAADINGFHGPSQLSDFIGSPQFGTLGLFGWAFQRDTPCTKPTPICVCPGGGRIGTELQDVGELILFIVPLGDVKLQERSIGSPIPSKTSFR